MRESRHGLQGRSPVSILRPRGPCVPQHAEDGPHVGMQGLPASPLVAPEIENPVRAVGHEANALPPLALAEQASHAAAEDTVHVRDGALVVVLHGESAHDGQAAAIHQCGCEAVDGLVENGQRNILAAKRIGQGAIAFAPSCDGVFEGGDVATCEIHREFFRRSEVTRSPGRRVARVSAVHARPPVWQGIIRRHQPCGWT